MILYYQYVLQQPTLGYLWKHVEKAKSSAKETERFSILSGPKKTIPQRPPNENERAGALEKCFDWHTNTTPAPFFAVFLYFLYFSFSSRCLR